MAPHLGLFPIRYQCLTRYAVGGSSVCPIYIWYVFSISKCYSTDASSKWRGRGVLCVGWHILRQAWGAQLSVPSFKGRMRKDRPSQFSFQSTSLQSFYRNRFVLCLVCHFSVRNVPMICLKYHHVCLKPALCSAALFRLLKLKH